jgi:hypothetical protein
MIGHGGDIAALISAITPHFQQWGAAVTEGKPPPEIDKEKLNAELAKLPETPDERLR